MSVMSGMCSTTSSLPPRRFDACFLEEEGVLLYAQMVCVPAVFNLAFIRADSDLVHPGS
jgi:hypothetical protein